MEKQKNRDTLLSLVRSPSTGARLQSASSELIDRLNSAIADGAIRDQSGDVVDSPLESGLVDMEKHCLFPVRQGIVILVSGQSIPLSEIGEKIQS